MKTIVVLLLVIMAILNVPICIWLIKVVSCLWMPIEIILKTSIIVIIGLIELFLVSTIILARDMDIHAFRRRTNRLKIQNAFNKKKNLDFERKEDNTETTESLN